MLRTILLSSGGRGLARRFCQAATSNGDLSALGFDFIQAKSDDKIGVVEIRRPRELNSLNERALQEIAEAMESFDKDPGVNVIILTGSDRVFAAGTDVSELVSRSYHNVRYRNDMFGAIDRVASVRKPVIAAVNGFALGTGCELALAADIVIASEDATFGQPEVQIGSIPTAGGTQRLVRAVGKAKAMEMVLTGRHMTAEEAESSGLVTRVTKKGEALREAKDVAEIISKHSLPVTLTAKECVNVGFETTLSEGLRFERRAFQSTFALDDCKEGMKAFVDGRKPHFSNR